LTGLDFDGDLGIGDFERDLDFETGDFDRDLDTGDLDLVFLTVFTDLTDLTDLTDFDFGLFLTVLSFFPNLYDARTLMRL